MTYIEDTRTIYLDGDQMPHDASTTYMLLQLEWGRGPQYLILDGWVCPGTLIVRHIASRN